MDCFCFIVRDNSIFSEVLVEIIRTIHQAQMEWELKDSGKGKDWKSGSIYMVGENVGEV